MTGGNALSVRADVTSEADARGVAEKTIAAFGRIDVLVNNAAIYYGKETKPFEFISKKEWDAMMAVNVKGLFMLNARIMFARTFRLLLLTFLGGRILFL